MGFLVNMHNDSNNEFIPHGIHAFIGWIENGSKNQRIFDSNLWNSLGIEPLSKKNPLYILKKAKVAYVKCQCLLPWNVPKLITEWEHEHKTVVSMNSSKLQFWLNKCNQIRLLQRSNKYWIVFCCVYSNRELVQSWCIISFLY